jgi:hypothetical protein
MRTSHHTFRKGVMDLSKPLFSRKEAITYPQRPKGHCTICWQSRARGSSWKHRECSLFVGNLISNLLNYDLPSLKIVLKQCPM